MYFHSLEQNLNQNGDINSTVQIISDKNKMHNQPGIKLSSRRQNGTKAVRLEGTPHLKIRQRVRVEGGADGVRRSVLAVAEMLPYDF